MIVTALLLATGPIGLAPVDAVPSDPKAAFEQSVKDYTEFTTPRCAPEEIYPYRQFNDRRDIVFRRSLQDTPLAAIYRAAVKAETARERNIVYECLGPPPPPPPPGTVAAPFDPRADAISEIQKRLRISADSQPGIFDRGDALFAAMVAARDRLLAGKH